MSSPHALVEKEGHVLVVTLNRPEARNALSPDMLWRMYEAWRLLDRDADLRCAILTGAGGTFCAGADLKTMGREQKPDEEMQKRMKEVPDLHWQALLRHNRPMKPIIAAVEGYAVAGGTEILQGTDIRVAGESAVFGVTEAKRGLFPLGGSTICPAADPVHAAAEILLTARHDRAGSEGVRSDRRVVLTDPRSRKRARSRRPCARTVRLGAGDLEIAALYDESS
jgi:enoyl-CoA hydratase